MDNNQRYLLRWWAIFFLWIILFAGTISTIIYIHDQQMIDAGYHRERVPYDYTNVWVK